MAHAGSRKSRNGDQLKCICAAASLNDPGAARVNGSERGQPRVRAEFFNTIDPKPNFADLTGTFKGIKAVAPIMKAQGHCAAGQTIQWITDVRGQLLRLYARLARRCAPRRYLLF